MMLIILGILIFSLLMINDRIRNILRAYFYYYIYKPISGYCNKYKRKPEKKEYTEKREYSLSQNSILNSLSYHTISPYFRMLNNLGSEEFRLSSYFIQRYEISKILLHRDYETESIVLKVYLPDGRINQAYISNTKLTTCKDNIFNIFFEMMEEIIKINNIRMRDNDTKKSI